MKVSLFEQAPYRYMPEGFENQHNSVRDDALRRSSSPRG